MTGTAWDWGADAQPLHCGGQTRFWSKRRSQATSYEVVPVDEEIDKSIPFQTLIIMAIEAKPKTEPNSIRIATQKLEQSFRLQIESFRDA